MSLATSELAVALEHGQTLNLEVEEKKTALELGWAPLERTRWSVTALPRRTMLNRKGHRQICLSCLRREEEPQPAGLRFEKFNKVTKNTATCRAGGFNVYSSIAAGECELKVV